MFQKLPLGDTEVISSAIIELGGTWRDGLTKDVTHLFVTNTNSSKYKVALSCHEQSRITILLPHWFDQCWSQQMRLPTKLFEFPDPLYFKKEHEDSWFKEQLLDARISGADPSNLSMDIDKSLILEGEVPAPAKIHKVWEKHCILLSSSLELDANRKNLLYERIENYGGVAIRCSEKDECDKVAEAHIYVTRFRSGSAYINALKQGKTIGTLRWLLSVEKSGIFISPRDDLLHYPVRPNPIPYFRAHVSY
jgi:mediator of DNA damage checkpoint protein 1